MVFNLIITIISIATVIATLDLVYKAIVCEDEEAHRKVEELLSVAYWGLIAVLIWSAFK